MHDFSQQLFGSWRAVGLDAAPRTDGALTFVCPRCVEPPTRLDITDGLALCPVCNWGSEGEPWKIAKEAAEARPKTEKSGGGLPAIVYGNEISAKSIELPEELITGVLHRGAKMVLGGGSKSFKTWCLADLATSIATGRQWWGHAVKQGKVVYLNLEVQGAFFEQRLQTIAHAKGCSLPADLLVWNLRGFCSDHRVLLPELARRLAGLQVAAIILDPTYKVMAGSENAQEEVAALMDSIEKMAIATGAAVIFGSHFAKGNAAGKEAIDRISGSGVFARDPDAILTMTRHEEDGVFVIDPILRNCPPIAPFCVRWEFPLMKAAPGCDVRALKQNAWNSKKSPVPPTPQQVLEVATKAAADSDELPGGVNVTGGLFKAVEEGLMVTREAARTAIERATEDGFISRLERKRADGKGKMQVFYSINLPKK